MTKSHISARIDVPKGQLANESNIHLKHGRPIGLKDITPHKRRKQRKIGAPKDANIKQKTLTKVNGEQEAPVETYIEQETPDKVQDKEIASKDAQKPENYFIKFLYFLSSIFSIISI